MIIRRANIEDAKGISHISVEFLKQHGAYSPIDKCHSRTIEEEENSWRKVLTKKEYAIFVAENQKKILGVITLLEPERLSIKKIKKVGEIEILMIEKDSQGKGIGKLLFEKSVEYFKNENIKYIICNVRLKNPALGFWKKLGFNEYDVKLLRRI